MAIATEAHHGLALQSDGSSLAWGDNYYGQPNVPIGDNSIDIGAGGQYYLAFIPEPATLVLFAFGGLALQRKRRAK